MLRNDDPFYPTAQPLSHTHLDHLILSKPSTSSPASNRKSATQNSTPCHRQTSRWRPPMHACVVERRSRISQNHEYNSVGVRSLSLLNVHSYPPFMFVYRAGGEKERKGRGRDPPNFVTAPLPCAQPSLSIVVPQSYVCNNSSVKTQRFSPKFHISCL
jgi:hypothetical protein